MQGGEVVVLIDLFDVLRIAEEADNALIEELRQASKGAVVKAA